MSTVTMLAMLMNRSDADGCASALQELIKLREEHGPEEKVRQIC
jgi:hypothetical protein